MKRIQFIAAGLLAAAFLALSLPSAAADKAPENKAAKKAEKVKPYLLKTCAVSDEKFGGDMKPYTFVHEGREVKLCCKECLGEFKKDPAKYIKKIEEAELKLEKKPAAKPAKGKS